MQSGGIVCLTVGILAERKQTGHQQTDRPPRNDRGRDPPTSGSQPKTQPRAEDHHQDAENQEVELLNPAVRTSLERTHCFGNGVVLIMSKQSLDDKPDSEKQRSNHAGDGSNRDEVPLANPAGQLRGRLLLCCHAWTLGRKRMSGIGASTQA
jgi:hypothetical protein